MKNILTITFFGGAFAISTLLGGCREYVEIDTYDQRTLQYTNDYQYLLNNATNFRTAYALPLATCDDVEASATGIVSWSTEFQNAYIWAEQYYSESQQDIGWNNLYEHVYIANEILAGVMESEGGTIEQKRMLAAEAKIHRAFSYLALANQYAPIYDPATAGSEPGLPLLLTTDIFQDLSRSNLQTVYDQILDDALTAVPDLPDQPAFNYHPGKGAAYALLSRCYLYMRNFEEAGRYADMALDLNSELLDLKTYEGNTFAIPRLLQDPEVLLQRIVAGSFTGRISDELINLYDTEDLRFKLFLAYDNLQEGYRYRRQDYTFQGVYIGLRVPELILNRAEVYARLGDVQNTVTLLNTLRQKRFATASYVALTASDIEADPLQAVIAERRREFVGTDLRWFDQRRLTLDPAYTRTVTRTYNGQTYTLDPASPRFVYPIEQKVLDMNPEIGQNPR